VGQEIAGDQVAVTDVSDFIAQAIRRVVGVLSRPAEARMSRSEGLSGVIRLIKPAT
jgi:hypothetical protein